MTLLEAIRTLESASGCHARIKGEAVQAGDVRHTWADLSLAIDELGYRPKVALDEGLRLETAWLQEPSLAVQRPTSPSTAESDGGGSGDPAVNGAGLFRRRPAATSWRRRAGE